MDTKIKIKFYSDPGHGWGAVKRNLLDSMSILDKISTFSYQKGQTVYLEEDRDLPVLVTQLALKGIEVEYQNSHSDRRSPIRNYEPFKI